jgi:Eukaryotic cytochrome b561
VLSSLISVLSLPISGSEVHVIAPWAYWHARLMVLSWGILLPMGVLIARFYKITPSQNWPHKVDNKLWWHSHRVLQWTGLLLMSAGAWAVWGFAHSTTKAAIVHSSIGWVLLIAGWLQALGSFARGSSGTPEEPGDHYLMTRKRLVFERIHKFVGWSALLASVVTIVLGLIIADAPRWMLLAMVAWWLLLGAAFVRLQKQGRCVDTYQAIWGPDPSHPGNRMKPIGWGVRRLQKN